MIGSKIAGQILQTWSAICSQPSSVCVQHVMLVSTAAAAFKLSWQPSAVYLCIFMRLRIGAGMPHKAKGFTMVYQYKPANTKKKKTSYCSTWCTAPLSSLLIL
jgi:hypothetical protein